MQSKMSNSFFIRYTSVNTRVNFEVQSPPPDKNIHRFEFSKTKVIQPTNGLLMPFVGCIYFLSCKDGGPGEDRTPDLRVANVIELFLRFCVIVRKPLYNAFLLLWIFAVVSEILPFVATFCDKFATNLFGHLIESLSTFK